MASFTTLALILLSIYSSNAHPTAALYIDNAMRKTTSLPNSVNPLFPVPNIVSGWSVAAQPRTNKVKTIQMTHNTFVIRKEATSSRRRVVQFEGKTAMRARMSKGSLDPGSTPLGGFSFYTPGPRLHDGTSQPLLDFKKGREITFSYSIFFEPGYAFNLGGKLPGLYGGVNDEVAKTCSGGRHDPRCFSARLMWRKEGEAELYLYLPAGLNQNDHKCGKAANEACETSYGASVGRGTWTWQTGVWQTVSQRILLNTPGKPDGEAEVYVDGRSVLNVGGLTWRGDPAAVVQGAQMQIFFGGHEDAWRSPKDQNVHFADFSGAVVR